jgi:hypothetical protein
MLPEVMVPATVSMLSVPEKVPLEGKEYVPVTSNVFAFAIPKLNAKDPANAHANASAAKILLFMISHPSRQIVSANASFGSTEQPCQSANGLYFLDKGPVPRYSAPCVQARRRCAPYESRR